MDQDYDRKFEEMKKYIPFLENMIKRLESNSSTSGNPRQAQLAKIRSLRDLLLDKKKRMKMENLLKCEQVLVNLYAKVEQRDSLSDATNNIDTSLGTQNSELNLVRNKLKNVVSHLKDQETLPEIARASNTEEACTAGSKEPALFQRRPNKTSISPSRPSLNDMKTSPSTSAGRTYTRVLMSPERDTTNWPQDISSGKPLYSRRSPRRTPKKSPRRHLSPHQKKSLNQSQDSNELKDLNITLKVPEESLNSLNTKDILSRIINCSDNDVDIDTLRGLRTQILSELKQTGAKDDISDLILKSYKNKKDSKKKKREEIEEGELSDSESEIIESIYGSLVIVDKEQNNESITKSDKTAQESRKIQICLVINSERENESETDKPKDLSDQSPVIDQSDFESYKHSKKDAQNAPIKGDFMLGKRTQESISNKYEKNKSVENKGVSSNIVISEGSIDIEPSGSIQKDDESKIITKSKSESPETLTPNFCKPVLNTDISKKIETKDDTNGKTVDNIDDVGKDDDAKQTQVDIPLLDFEATAKHDVVNEIDILQALKKEILGEKISVADSKTVTPPLHQPKVTKVANMQGMITKKRISIEKYKEKTTTMMKPLFLDEATSNSPKDDFLKKQSLKLTEKEFERFNLSNKLTFDESSEDEILGKRSPTVEDVYADLAPKSPDHEDFADTGIKPPVIIPVDPVKTPVVSSKADIDMRLTSVYSPHLGVPKLENKKGATSMNCIPSDVCKKDIELYSSEKRIPLADPRVSRRDFNNSNQDSSMLGPVEHTPRPLLNFSPNMTPSMIPNMIPNMTPNRMPGISQSSNVIPNMIANSNSNTGVYEMTPSRQTFENDDYLKQSHVYAPMFQGSDTFDNSDIVNNETLSGEKFSSKRSNFENVRTDLATSNNEFQNSLFNRSECPQTPIHPFGMTDCPSTPTHAFGHLEPPMTPIQTFGRCDAPMTPVHPFGRADCPPTPSHPFGGRADCPPTPSHPFGGRADCPPTPNHPFGSRADCPPTPNHPFGGRVDCPPTPNHPFGGRAEILMTPSHPFGRTDFCLNTQQIPPPLYNNFQDHIPNRSSDYDNFSNYNEEMDCNDYKERNSSFSSRNYKYEQTQRNYSDTYRNYGRQPNNSRGNKKSYDQCDSHYGEISRRDSSIGRSMSANNKNAGHYSNDRKGYRGRGYRYENDNAKNIIDVSSRNNFNREHSVGRNLTERNLEGKDVDLTSDKILSIQSHAGRPFDIDTSVNRSFQETPQGPTFDARRRRASSVGRSLIEEQSSGRVSTSTNYDKNSPSLESDNKFRRACSVGRDTVPIHEKKNFNDIKQELQSYKHKHDEKFNTSKNAQNNAISTDVRKKINERDPRFSRRDEYDIQRSKNERGLSKTHSQRRYNRDPRLRQEFHKDSQKNNPDGLRSNSREEKKHGIVYSTDNLTKGTILGSGYGVKNYKIPKIKKASQETSSQEVNDNDKTSKDKSIEDSSNKKTESEKGNTTGLKQKQERRDSEKRSTRWDKITKKAEEDSQKQESQNKDSQNINKSMNQEESTFPSVDNVEKRITRSSQRNNPSEPLVVKSESPKRKYNKIKKLEDSDTESAEIIINKAINEKSGILEKGTDVVEPVTMSQDKNANALCNVNENEVPDSLVLEHKNEEKHMKEGNSSCNKIIMTKVPKAESNSNSVQDKVMPSVTENNNSFGVELEIFSENVATDPVIENINALIADLDDDLETSKNDGSKNQFTKEITLENMLDSITCDEKRPNLLNKSHDEIYRAKLIKNNKCSIDSQICFGTISTDSGKNLKENNQELNDNSGVEIKYQTENNTVDINIPNSEVSTTEEETSSISLKKAESQPHDDQKEYCSTPDSTIDLNENNQDKNGQEEAPDSTNELNCEMSSDITSTHIESKDNLEKNAPRTELAHQNDSIGSLLSILKDKSKIKELLTMLKDQSSENFKLKKKLEKLSEIVSDDEDFSPSESNFSNCCSNVSNNSQVEALNRTEIATKQPKEEVCSINIGLENKQKEKDTNSIGQDDESEEKTVDVKSKKQEQDSERTKDIEDLKDKEQLDETEKCILNVNSSNESQTENYSSISQIDTVDIEQTQTNKKPPKNVKTNKKTKPLKNNPSQEKKRFTRSDSGSVEKSPPVKKPSRELKQLQNDIKEMFMHDDVFNATGIRMCRIAKLVEDTTSTEKDEKNNSESSPEVVLEKVKNSTENLSKAKISKKKQPPKSKVTQKESLITVESGHETLTEQKLFAKNRPGPKSKTKVSERLTDTDPYVFESDSFSESNNTNTGESKLQSSSESECESLESSNSLGSNDFLGDTKKKPKRKRRGWQVGVIKSKNKKKKNEVKNVELSQENGPGDTVLDENCFTDKTYCFAKNVAVYPCRFCTYNGNNIVHHYKKQHPHSEIPLSRMSPDIAKAAIEQCEEINFQAICKVPMDRYVCRFCFKEFSKKKTALEAFFWHVVSVHTGEYKQLCSECVNVTRCPFNLDIPPPPKEPNGQLIGYICGKCNFTQISLENLKSHVINRHNDEQTEVYTINLSVMTKKTLLALSKSNVESKSTAASAPRVLRSRRSNNLAENNDEIYIQDAKDTTFASHSHTDADKMTSDCQNDVSLNENQKGKRRISTQLHTSLGNVEADSEMCKVNDSTSTFELGEENNTSNSKTHEVERDRDMMDSPVENVTNTSFDCLSDDVLDYPHFKVNFTESGTKEYVCCINGIENHYRTALLISFKKHVQLKHKEKWDGFCFVCKLIVTSQGNHNFKDCLQHFLDKHIDDFPVMEKLDKETDSDIQGDSLTKSYLNVRPMSELMSQSDAQFEQSTLPVIESVVSLGELADEAAQAANATVSGQSKEVQYKYEEAQAVVMASKNNVVRGIMMNREKLVHIFKCAGRYCSYSTDNAESALRHAVTHERVGGENSLDCTYCDFDSSKNAVDLVTHVFKAHGGCPFVCGRCFYRAAAGQLVRAHELRLHGQEPSLVYRSTVTARTSAAEKVLPRDIAVSFYVCSQDSGNGVCQFKTYTPVKFNEHLQTRHKTDNVFSCSICSMLHRRSSDLIQHMKIHGFKVYQCTWCVHGADSEMELLAHASEKHPNKQPQAYLRIITNKEGTTGFRVLPLAQFNNSKIATIDVTPNSLKGNPEKEAERSIDLEKLIGQTTQMMESMVTSAQNTVDDAATGNDDDCVTYLDSEALSQSQESLITGLKESLLNEIEEELTTKASLATTSVPPRPETSNSMNPMAESDIYEQLAADVKVKPEPFTPDRFNSDVVYCLDSDEEAPNQSVIDLSAEESSPVVSESNRADQPIRLPPVRLFKCGLCRNMVLKSAIGFKRHVSALHPQEVNQLTCAHCSFVGQRDVVAAHYVSEHMEPQQEVKRYICEVCGNKYVSFTFVKKHLKDDHNLTKLVVTSKEITDGKYHFVVGEVVKKKKAMKRKLSTHKKASQPPAKMKKFGPDDVDALPINPILDELVHCALCEFNTKVRLNMVRHLQLHAELQPVPQTNPVNPVPYLETNEKHFDKMLNLASSSFASTPLRPDRNNKEERQPALGQAVPPETMSRYPKYVPDKQRYTCGAKACCYTSVDEKMFKQHWETLHSGSSDYRCVHCPPHQHMDTSKPLTALRIVSHLKMHGANLYACSGCPYYHNVRHMVETHIAGNHGAGNVMVVRETSEPAPSVSTLSQPPVATPTMDLKPWQCGLCNFKSMLRPEVVDHCAKMHQSKMQYKCTYCAFRASNLENITKHQSKSHANKAPETFYFYYREGSIPNEPDGTPRWHKQRQKGGIAETRVKTEVVESPASTSQSEAAAVEPPPISIPVVDLNIVKRDPDAEPTEHPVEELCAAFGQFCEPNGLKYKCPLCENVSEETREAMQSHLYEELQYRKWACGFCSYKAFHRNGLNEHMDTEHRQHRDPIELPVDPRVETWITKALDHQFLSIERNRHNLASLAIAKPKAGPSTPKQAEPSVGPASGDNCDDENLQNMFGQFGEPDGVLFNCPKCNYKVREESAMRNHLEIELTKIRWCCNSCSGKFQNYHEAQFHCKSAHAGFAAKPVEAVRDAGKRTAWTAATLRTQMLAMEHPPAPTEGANDGCESEHNIGAENSLLVVRYEEPISATGSANLRGMALESDEEEERLVIHEPSKTAAAIKQCPFCTFRCQEQKAFRDHIVYHTNIKPYFCSYCDFNGYRKTVLKHLNDKHEGRPPLLMTRSQRSQGPPLGTAMSATATPSAADDEGKLICLRCEKSFSDNDAKGHAHDNVRPPFAKKGELVVKCCVCLRLHQSIEEATAHHRASHPHESLSYAYYRLQTGKRSVFRCAYCELQFKYWQDLKAHWTAAHSSLPMQFNKRNFCSSNLSDEEESGLKRRSESPADAPPPKMCARKSTTKLPLQTVARKSTTKLPLSAEQQEEYCHYGSKPRVDDLDNITTSMTFCNTDVPFTLKKLSEIIKIDPIVLVEDVRK